MTDRPGARSEFGLIEAIRERLDRAGAPRLSPGMVVGSGDDAAIVERSGASATSVDALVEDVHFRIPPFTLEAVGRKALAVALSDLAAVGAAPAEAYVQLGLPERLAERALELADGFAAVAAEHGVAIAGGDVVRSRDLFCAVTVTGTAPAAADLVRRAGAGDGHLLFVSGELGGAAAGLLLLERPELAERIDAGVAEALRRRQTEPKPLLGLGLAMASSGAAAMIDISDGLAADAAHLASASAVGLEIEAARLPVADGVAAVAGAAGADPLELVAGGGEDYELLVAAPADRAAGLRAAATALGADLTEIGVARAGSGVRIRLPDGSPCRLGGFDQLAAGRAPNARA